VRFAKEQKKRLERAPGTRKLGKNGNLAQELVASVTLNFAHFLPPDDSNETPACLLKSKFSPTTSI
jgi:hypothetical protein